MGPAGFLAGSGHIRYDAIAAAARRPVCMGPWFARANAAGSIGGIAGWNNGPCAAARIVARKVWTPPAHCPTVRRATDR